MATSRSTDLLSWIRISLNSFVTKCDEVYGKRTKFRLPNKIHNGVRIKLINDGFILTLRYQDMSWEGMYKMDENGHVDLVKFRY